MDQRPTSRNGFNASEYARRRGCSSQYVNRLRREGRLALHADGSIDPEASDALLLRTVDPSRGGRRAGNSGPAAPAPKALPTPAPRGEPDPLDGVTLGEAMRRERLAKARKAELELAEAAGALLRKDVVERLWFTLSRQAVEALRAVRHRVATQLAAETDPHRCGLLLEKEIEYVCAQLIAADPVSEDLDEEEQ